MELSVFSMFMELSKVFWDRRLRMRWAIMLVVVLSVKYKWFVLYECTVGHLFVLLKTRSDAELACFQNILGESREYSWPLCLQQCWNVLLAAMLMGCSAHQTGPEPALLGCVLLLKRVQKRAQDSVSQGPGCPSSRQWAAQQQGFCLHGPSCLLVLSIRCSAKMNAVPMSTWVQGLCCPSCRWWISLILSHASWKTSTICKWVSHPSKPCSSSYPFSCSADWIERVVH